MQLRGYQLADRLARTIDRLYIVHGDEPLLQIETADAIRAAARAAGCAEREVLIAEAGFDWDQFAAINRNLSLFAERRLIDLRIPNGKPGTDGARVLQEYAAALSPDNVTLISLPRLDRTAQASAWFAALEAAGVAIATYPLERNELPQWIAGRLARQQQQVNRETLQYLSDLTEGNLLAAHQEVEKLGLLLPAGNISHDVIERLVADVARFDILQLSEAWLNGEPGRVFRILCALQAEGEGVPLLLWQLGDDVHALAQVLAAVAEGVAVSSAVKNVRVWGKRQPALERAARRVKPAEVPPLLQKLSRLDAMAKGVGQGNVWDELTQAALALAGAPLGLVN